MYTAACVHALISSRKVGGGSRRKRAGKAKNEKLEGVKKIRREDERRKGSENKK